MAEASWAMAKVIFTIAESSAYDDQPEYRYHFPRTYLRQAKEAIGDWILYYEPRRTTGPSSSGGRQAYFAMARVNAVEQDRTRADHFYAYVDGYLEFDNAVPFREGNTYYESALRKGDGAVNKGAFGRSVRGIPEEEFALIVRAGFSEPAQPWEEVEETEVPEYHVRPVIQQVLSRKFRDRAFVRHVRRAYNNTCAITGLRLTNGGGRPEVEAAHIRSVEADGPDTVRNGLALTGTLHWMFDRGLIAVSDDYEVILSDAGLPDTVRRLLPPTGKLLPPMRPEWRPHKTYLAWHRRNVFKG